MAYERLLDDEELLAEEKRPNATYLFVRRSTQIIILQLYVLSIILNYNIDPVFLDSNLSVSLKNTIGARSLSVAFVKKILQDVFLPRGYPSSVSSDYMDYQIWDTVQVNSPFSMNNLNSLIVDHLKFSFIYRHSLVQLMEH